jgi:hypothetical protein
MIKTQRSFRRRKPRSAPVPPYLLPPLARAVVFDPSLRRAGSLVAEMTHEPGR